MRTTLMLVALAAGAGCASSHKRGQHIYAVKQCNARAAAGLPDEDGYCADVLDREDRRVRRRQAVGQAMQGLGNAYTAAGTR